jgi:hypothetical protein
MVFCVATVGTYAYMVHTFFSLDVPRWEALAWSAAQAPMYLVPAFVVPMLRKIYKQSELVLSASWC